MNRYQCPACGRGMGAVETHWCRAVLGVVRRKPSPRDIAAALELLRPPVPPPAEELGEVPW